MEKKESHTKLDDIVYEKIQMQPYLKSQLFFQQDAKTLFRLRSNMFNVKRNFSSLYSTNLNCILCQAEIEDQQHLLNCQNLKSDDETDEQFIYSNIYSKDVKKVSEILKILLKKIRRRENIINDILVEI